MKTPSSITVHMSGEPYRRYAVESEDFDMFYNPESSEWDAIPSFFYGRAIRPGGLGCASCILSSNQVNKVVVKF